MTNILILGAAGQMGQALLACATNNKLVLSAVDRTQCDITNSDHTSRVIGQSQAKIVINLAAMTNVDGAETDSESAIKINRYGAANVARACAASAKMLIHLSTDYVFPDSLGAPFVESDDIKPLNIYGASKAEGEAEIREILPNHIIMRTSWIYSQYGKNFFHVMMRLAEARDHLKIVSDERSCPTFADDLAKAILGVSGALLGPSPCFGTFHACGSQAYSRLEYAQAIMAARSQAGLRVPSLQPISQCEFGAAARRPIDSAMSCAKLQSVYGITLRGLSAVVPGLVGEMSPTPQILSQ